MTDRHIYRYKVPVDDEWHRIQVTGDIVHVAAHTPAVVEVWVYEGTRPQHVKELRVFGTGHVIPPGHDGTPLRHVGTALVDPFVWHLMQRMASSGEH